MPEEVKRSDPFKLTPAGVLQGESPLVLTATLEPIGGDRFQPAGFPEIGHVIYRAPRKDGSTENVCIVDSAASMANHLEAVCQRGAHDVALVDDLAGMPYIRCVTGDPADGRLPSDRREVVVTSLTEGHRIASSYFLEGTVLCGETQGRKLQEELVDRFGILLPRKEKKTRAEKSGLGSKTDAPHPKKKNEVAYLPLEKWWNVFEAIYALDPNSLVHGVLFPQWQIKIPRALTAHLEAFGAARVDRSGVKFDRLGKTTSGQPIFAVDDATAESIRATFVLDVSLVRSFGRTDEDGRTRGLGPQQQEFLVTLALWKIHKLLASPFRFRSGCHLRCTSLTTGERHVEIDVDIRAAIAAAGFPVPPVTDVFWPRDDLYRAGEKESEESAEGDGAEADDEAE